MAVRAAHAPIINLQPVEEVSDDIANADLLALLVSQGEPFRDARVRAATLLELAGGVHGLPFLSKPQLELAGLTPQSITRFRAAIHLGRRVASFKPTTAPLTDDMVAAIFHPLLNQLTHEEMHVVMLDARGRYRSRRRVASGGVAACSVFVKDIAAPVIEARAHSFVLVHNHPSGICTPSPEDFALTSRVITAADTLGIRLIDHLVIAEDGHASAMPGGGRWNQRRHARTVSRPT